MALCLLGDSSDVALRNAIISACGRGFQWEMALEPGAHPARVADCLEALALRRRWLLRRDERM